MTNKQPMDSNGERQQGMLVIVLILDEQRASERERENEKHGVVYPAA